MPKFRGWDRNWWIWKCNRKVECFNETLLPKTKPEEETEQKSFIKIILCTLRYDKENKIDICDKNEFKKLIDEKLIDQLDEEKYKFILDLQKFNNNCYEIYYQNIISF